MIRELIARDIPTFGICLGHQMLGIAVGGKTDAEDAPGSHHGANHPGEGPHHRQGRDHLDEPRLCGRSARPLPANIDGDRHVSLFDGSNCGIALKDRPVISVQYHPEVSSPGPRDSHYLFDRFVGADAGRAGRELSPA